MTQQHNPPSECPRLGGAGTTRKALRTVRSTAVPGMWVNGTCPCDPFHNGKIIERSGNRFFMPQQTKINIEYGKIN